MAKLRLLQLQSHKGWAQIQIYPANVGQSFEKIISNPFIKLVDHIQMFPRFDRI
jgi:hypothetical protein